MSSLKDNTVLGKILSFLIGIYGVHIYLLYILYENKFLWISVFTVTTATLLLGILLNPTVQQIIWRCQRRWYNTAILLFLGYYTFALFLHYFAFGLSLLTPLWTVVLPGFLLGILANVSFERSMVFRGMIAKISDFRNAKQVYFTLALFWLLVVIYEGLQIYQNRISLTLSLITINNDYYQDLGDYCCVFYVGWLAIKDHFYRRDREREIEFGKFLLWSIIELLTIVLFLQVLGSNKAPLLIVGIGLLYIFYNRPRSILANVKIIGISIFGLLMLILILQFTIGDFNLTGLRFFSELDNGVTENSSVTSRFDQVGQDGVNQLGQYVIFGNIGITNYIHSSIITIQTHLGLVGSLLFWTFVLFHGYYIYFKSNDKISKAILIPVLVVSAISSAFWWLPLWFSLGFVYMRK